MFLPTQVNKTYPWVREKKLTGSQTALDQVDCLTKYYQRNIETGDLKENQGLWTSQERILLSSIPGRGSLTRQSCVHYSQASNKSILFNLMIKTGSELSDFLLARENSWYYKNTPKLFYIELVFQICDNEQQRKEIPSRQHKQKK